MIGQSSGKRNIPKILEQLTQIYKFKDGKISFNSEEEEEKFLHETHNILIHPGISKHIFTINNCVAIKILKSRISSINAKCLACNRNKHFNQKKYYTIGSYSSNIPFEKMAMDIKGPIASHKFDTQLKFNSFYILVVVDICTRIVSVAFLQNIRSQDIIKGFTKCWLNEYHKPKLLLTDQGHQFISVIFNSFVKKHKIKHIFTSPYNPRCNGIVERVNKTVGEILRLYRGHNITDLKLQFMHVSIKHGIGRQIRYLPNIIKTNTLNPEKTTVITHKSHLTSSQEI